MKNKDICKAIGCSGIDDKCPGNSKCKILRKIKHALDLTDKREED